MAASIASTSSLLHPSASISVSSRSEAPGAALSSLRFRQELLLPSTSSSGGASAQRAPRSWRQVNATYSNYSPGYGEIPIDVPADKQAQKILVLGGNGFVGTAVCKAAVRKNISVVSLSRSGRPKTQAPWADQVSWVAGDVFLTDWDSLLSGVEAVVSTLGLIGPNEQMEKIDGDANIIAVNEAKKAGVKKFIYISVHDYNLPAFALNNGYFIGKRKAESEILTAFPTSGTILRPGFIYGTRKVNGIDIPLNIFGQPLEKLLDATATITRPLQNLPASDLLLASPVDVDDVAAAVITAVVQDSYYGIFTIEQIKSMAKELVF